MNDASPIGRIVKTKSIPNVSADRLVNDIAVLHDRVHTADGIHAFSATRRTLVETGMKILKMGSSPTSCVSTSPSLGAGGTGGSTCFIT